MKTSTSPVGLEARRDEVDVAVEQRAELARVLAAVAWPATASKLAAAAVDADADGDLVDRLAALPARRRYAALGAVWSALGGTDVDELARAAPEPRPTPTPATAPEPRHHRFGFAFAPLFLPFAVPLGITPRTAWVDVDDEQLEVRFGPWVLRTEVANVAGAEISGPYSLPKVLGPPRLSLRDAGITFATNRRQGVCLRFHEPVPGMLPAGRRWLTHPGATVTVADPEALVAALVA